MKILYLITGGAAGTLCRYFLAAAIYQAAGSRFPFGTLAVNVTGCFLIGGFYFIAENRAWAPHAVLFLFIIGFCGSFTTFSSFILDNSLLAESGHAGLALVNILASLAAGFAAFYAGLYFARSFF